MSATQRPRAIASHTTGPVTFGSSPRRAFIPPHMLPTTAQLARTHQELDYLLGRYTTTEIK